MADITVMREQLKCLMGDERGTEAVVYKNTLGEITMGNTRAVVYEASREETAMAVNSGVGYKNSLGEITMGNTRAVV